MGSSRPQQFGFSRAQQPKYRAWLPKAFEIHCERTGLNPDADGAFKNWQRNFLVDMIGLPSSATANQTEHYDRVMLGLAQIIGEDHEIAYYSSALERRMRHLIEGHRAKLAALKG